MKGYKESYENEPIAFSDIYTYDGAESYYVEAEFPHSFACSDYDLYYNYYKEIAKELGGALTSINSKEELIALCSKFRNHIIGMRYNKEEGCYKWDDETNNYELGIPDSTDAEKLMFVVIYYYNSEHCYATNTVSRVLLEFPKSSVAQEDLQKKLDNYEFSETLLDKIRLEKSSFTQNAVLNPILNTDPDAWATLLAAEYTAGNKGYVEKNYWGTENTLLIDKMITDGHDYPGTYLELETDPILTTESPELEDIYPFVSKLEIWEENGEQPVTNIAPSTTYEVRLTFNREMDTTVSPSVTYGGEAPYTDYAITDGVWKDSKTWSGTFKVSSVYTGGKMYWRVKGGVADSDKWLVCGTDIERFSFTVSQIGALSMVLSATGGEDKIDLQWIQNDYDTLAGYNLYRSTTENGSYKKLNTSVLSEPAYTDTDVKPGVTYYYYFKVVNTTGVEEGNASNTANAAPLDNIAPVLKHTAITTGKAGGQITVSATATDNIAVTAVKLHYRKTGDSAYTTLNMSSGITANLYVVTIPAVAVTGAGVEHYITAEDGTNAVYSGTAAQPNAITVDTAPYIIGITPTTDVVAGGKTITILGGNFTADLVLKVGETVVTNKTLVNDGEIRFTAPAMPGGAYAVTLTTADGLATVAASSKLSYTDDGSVAEIPQSMEMLVGRQYQIPLYVTTSGELYSVHAELDLSTSTFSNVSVVKANTSANFTIDKNYSYSTGKLTIGCISLSDMRPASNQPLLYIRVTPKETSTMQEEIALSNVQFNGADVKTIISGTAYLANSYTVNGTVKYYTGNKYVEGVTIPAGDKTAITDANGTAAITVTQSQVTAFAQKHSEADTTAITAYDASLVLQSAIGLATLNDNQKIAVDVDGDGDVNEYDAALILQKSVRKINRFPAGDPWVFVPATKDMTLSNLGTGNNKVTFTAILLGDVDGSYATAIE